MEKKKLDDPGGTARKNLTMDLGQKKEAAVLRKSQVTKPDIKGL